MPELPEVETVCCALRQTIIKQIINRVIIRHYALRWPVEKNLAEVILHQPIVSISRRGKYILLQLVTGTLIIHLGMSGHIKLLTQPQPSQKHDHYDFIFSNQVTLRYHDPRRFGALIWTEEPVNHHPLIAAIGLEPLTPAFNAAYLQSMIHKRKTAIKTLLMNSHIVAGIGNIYANETLFSAGVLPSRAGDSLTLNECKRICTATKKVLQKAIAAGGTTLNDFYQSDGKPGYFAQKLLVYARADQPCMICKQPIASMMINHRSTYFCKHCQK